MSETSLDREFGKRLRGFRISQHMTQHNLARRCGLTSTGIARIERGESSPNLRTLFLLAGALHVKVGYLIGE